MRKGRKWLPAVLSVAMVLQPFAGIGSVTAMAADGVNIDDTFRNDSIFKSMYLIILIQIAMDILMQMKFLQSEV